MIITNAIFFNRYLWNDLHDVGNHAWILTKRIMRIFIRLFSSGAPFALEKEKIILYKIRFLQNESNVKMTRLPYKMGGKDLDGGGKTNS